VEFVIVEVKLVVGGKRLFIGVFSWNEFSGVELLGFSNGLSGHLLIILLIDEFNKIIGSWELMSDCVSLGAGFSDEHHNSEAHSGLFHHIVNIKNLIIMDVIL